MKKQTATKKHSLLMFSALASLMLMTAACQKSGGGGGSAPAVVTPTCTIQPCAGVPGGGVELYSGMTNGTYAQTQFQVLGDPGGNGMGSIAGVVNMNNYICAQSSPYMNGPYLTLMGPYSIQMTQSGSLVADVFTGYVNLVGPQGTIPAAIKVVPTRTAGTGLFSLYLCGAELSSNF